MSYKSSNTGLNQQKKWDRDSERPSWQALEEDADGHIVNLSGSHSRDLASTHGGLVRSGVAQDATPLQRGLLRHVFLVLDFSAASTAEHLRPSRAGAVISAALSFVSAFFESNPISYLGLFIARAGIVEKICDLTGNAARVRSALRARVGGVDSPIECAGGFSFEHVLRATTGVLALHPAVAAREVIVVHSALASVDPGDVFVALRDACKARVVVSILSLAGEVFLAAKVAAETGGTYTVPEDAVGLRSALMAHCIPPVRRAVDAAVAAAAGPVPVGFPTRHHETEAMCACHHVLRSATYECPRCCARACDIPSECAVCGLRLLSAPSLARSYHLIFPVAPFIDCDDGSAPAAACAACWEPLDVSGTSSTLKNRPRKCPFCGIVVCTQCDDVIHHDLHACPGCS